RHWDAIADTAGGEPTEATLRWGGGTRRQRSHSWACRPHLRDADGHTHVFDGADIPGVCTVLKDVSRRSGPSNGRCEAYEVLLFPGVTYAGNDIPQEDSPSDGPAEHTGTLG